MGNTTKKGVDKMIMLVLSSIIKTITFLIIAILIVLLLNYLFINDFRKLVNKIKRVILNPRKVNKITQIQRLIYNYFF